MGIRVDLSGKKFAYTGHEKGLKHTAKWAGEAPETTAQEKKRLNMMLGLY